MPISTPSDCNTWHSLFIHSVSEFDLHLSFIYQVKLSTEDLFIFHFIVCCCVEWWYLDLQWDYQTITYWRAVQPTSPLECWALPLTYVWWFCWWPRLGYLLVGGLLLRIASWCTVPHKSLWNGDYRTIFHCQSQWNEVFRTYIWSIFI